MWNTKELMKEEREGKICAGRAILSLWALIPSPCTHRPCCACRAAQQSQTFPCFRPVPTWMETSSHWTKPGALTGQWGTPCKDGSLNGWRFAQEARCYKQGVCTIFALRRVCVLCGDVGCMLAEVWIKAAQADSSLSLSLKFLVTLVEAHIYIETSLIFFSHPPTVVQNSQFPHHMGIPNCETNPEPP